MRGVLSASALILMVGCAGSLPMGSDDPVERLVADIDSVLADSVFRSTVPSVKVFSPSTGETLYEKNSDLLVRPASNMKLLTSALGLHVLGPQYQFKTSIGWDSVSVDSVIPGDLYLKGYGNPDLSTRDLDSMATRLAAMGIKSIGGNIVADASFLDSLQWGTGWMWDDEPAPYQAYVSGLSINKNCIRVTVTPDSTGNSVLVSTDPETDYVHVISTATIAVDSVLNRLSVARPITEPPNTIVVTGEVMGNARPYRDQITVLWPELYAGQLLKERLALAGISVTGGVARGRLPAGAREHIWHVWGMDSMVINLNKVSDNLSAEMVLKTSAAALDSPPGSSRSGVWAVNRFLASCGIDTTNHAMVDGSGLSHYNLLRVNLLVDLLTAMYANTDVFPLYYTSLPIGGVDGTLERRMLGTLAEGNVHAKTGSISGVSSLSGYVTTRDGEMLIFGMTMQDFILPSRAYRDAQDKICGILAEFRRRERKENGE